MQVVPPFHQPRFLERSNNSTCQGQQKPNQKVRKRKRDGGEEDYFDYFYYQADVASSSSLVASASRSCSAGVSETSSIGSREIAIDRILPGYTKLKIRFRTRLQEHDEILVPMLHHITYHGFNVAQNWLPTKCI